MVATAHLTTAEQIVQDNVARLRVPDPYALEPVNPLRELKTVGAAGASAGARIDNGVSVPVPHDPVPPLPGHAATVPDGVGWPSAAVRGIPPLVCVAAGSVLLASSVRAGAPLLARSRRAGG